jgi:hypothetical protein
VERPAPGQVGPQGLPKRFRQHGHSILRPFAPSQPDLSPIQVDVLDPEGEALEQPKAASIESIPINGWVPLSSARTRRTSSAVSTTGSRTGAWGRGMTLPIANGRLTISR